MPLINSNDEFLKSIAMLTLAYIVEEEENAKLIDETGKFTEISVRHKTVRVNRRLRKDVGKDKDFLNFVCLHVILVAPLENISE